MSKSETNIGLISNDAQKRLDISINVSHNRPLSRQSVIQLVKLLPRQAAEEDHLIDPKRDQKRDRYADQCRQKGDKVGKCHGGIQDIREVPDELNLDRCAQRNEEAVDQPGR